jgi:hypothetical protein
MRYHFARDTFFIGGSLTARVQNILSLSLIVDRLSSVNTSVPNNSRHSLPEFVAACKTADDITNAREEVRIVERMFSQQKSAVVVERRQPLQSFFEDVFHGRETAECVGLDSSSITLLTTRSSAIWPA